MKSSKKLLAVYFLLAIFTPSLFTYAQSNEIKAVGAKKDISELNILVIGHSNFNISKGRAEQIASTLRTAYGTQAPSEVRALTSSNVLDSIYSDPIYDPTSNVVQSPSPLKPNEFLKTLQDPKWDYIVYVPVPQSASTQNFGNSYTQAPYGNTTSNTLRWTIPIVSFNQYSYVIESVLALKRSIPKQAKIVIGVRNSGSENNVAFIHKLAHNTKSLATLNEDSQNYVDAIAQYQNDSSTMLIPYQDTLNYRSYLTFRPGGYFSQVSAAPSGTSTENRLRDHLVLLTTDNKNNTGAPCNVASPSEAIPYKTVTARPVIGNGSPNIPNLNNPYLNSMTRTSFSYYFGNLPEMAKNIPMTWQYLAERDRLFGTIEAAARWFSWLQDHPVRAAAHPWVTTDDNTHVASCVSAVMASAYYTVHTNQKALFSPKTPALLAKRIRTLKRQGQLLVGGTWLTDGCPYADLVAAYDLGYKMVIEHQYAGDFDTLVETKQVSCGVTSQVLPEMPSRPN